MRSILVSFLCAVSVQCATSRAIDLSDVERRLTTTGVEGEVHGAVPGSKLYVFTFRNPDNFFDYVHMSMLSSDPGVREQLKGLSRHDRIRIHGKFLENPSPQKHIAIDKLEVIKPYELNEETPVYQHSAKLPDELMIRDSATFLVHAVHQDGHILVVEYKDAVIPIFVRDATKSKELSRNDIVKLKFHVQSRPHAPTHLELDESASQPIEVIDAISSLHDSQAFVEGPLVLFPKSPQVLFNVFAVLDELEGGLKRQYTLVNFEDQAVFRQIREKLQKAWDLHPNEFVNGRNKLISKHVRVRAKGRFNQIDPNQANAQIILDSADAIEIMRE